MQRRHFELIARLFNREIGLSRPGTRERSDTAVLVGLARLMASELAGTNTLFNRERFLQACGLSEKEIT